MGATEATQTKIEIEPQKNSNDIIEVIGNISIKSWEFGNLPLKQSHERPKTIQQVKAEVEAGSIDHNKIRRSVGTVATKKIVTNTEQRNKSYEKDVFQGNFIVLQKKQSQEFKTNMFHNGETGITVVVKCDNGDRMIINQEYPEGSNKIKLSGIKSLNELLDIKVPKDAQIERCVILAPRSEKIGKLSDDHQFLDLLNTVVDNANNMRGHNNDKMSVVQTIAYEKDQIPNEYIEPTITVKCKKDGSTEIYHGTELLNYEDTPD